MWQSLQNKARLSLAQLWELDSSNLYEAQKRLSIYQSIHLSIYPFTQDLESTNLC